LLTVSWLLFQYSRISNYQSCRITPLSSLPAIACDCQKQTPEAITGDKQQHGTENAAFKSRPEDVFLGRPLFTPGHPTLLLLQDKIDRIPSIVAGCPAGIFQPPRGNVFPPLFI